MKRSFAFFWGILSVLPAFAHAGFYDSFLDQYVTARAILCTVALTHIILFLTFRYTNSKRIKEIKRKIIKISAKLHSTTGKRMLTSWGLSTIVWGFYLSLANNMVFLFGALMVILPAWIVYIIILCIRRWRGKFLFGTRAIYNLILNLIFMMTGIILYTLLCSFQWYQELFSYQDEEMEMLEYCLKPSVSGLIEVFYNIMDIGILFAIPVFIFAIIYIIKNKVAKKERP